MCVQWKLYQVAPISFKIKKFEAYYGSLNDQSTINNIPKYIKLTFENKTRFFETNVRPGGTAGIISIKSDTFPSINDGTMISLDRAKPLDFYLHRFIRDPEQFINLLAFLFGLGVVIDLSFDIGKVQPVFPYFGVTVVFIMKLVSGILKVSGLVLVLLKGWIVTK